MKKQLLLLSAILFTITSFAQIVFEKGYFIDNSDQKFECLIKNVDWKSNPTSFEYKLSEDSENKTGTLDNVKEFEVYNESKYVRFKGNIDRSGDEVNAMSNQQNPQFNEESLYLKVLIEGKADLYEYTDKNLKRYFYSVDGSDVEQLVYKRYTISATDESGNTKIDSYGRPETEKIGVNNTYKQQLWNTLKCPSINQTRIEKLEYKTNSMLKFFSEYNKCHDQESVSYKKETSNFFNLNIRPGVNFSSLTMENTAEFTSSKYEYDYGSQTNFRLGIEAEFIMPFLKNKLGIIIEPTYQYFKGEATSTQQTVTVDYKSIELPLGVRYYIFLNDKSKFFVNGQLCFDINLNSTLERSISEDLDVSSRINFALGAGYKYNDKFSIEARYLTPRNILGDYLFWNTDYNTVSLILGYTLIHK